MVFKVYKLGDIHILKNACTLLIKLTYNDATVYVNKWK